MKSGFAGHYSLAAEHPVPDNPRGMVEQRLKDRIFSDGGIGGGWEGKKETSPLLQLIYQYCDPANCQ